MLIRRFLLPFLMLAATAFPLHAQDDPVISDDLSELRVSLKEEYLQCDQEKQFFYEEYDIVHEQIVQLLEKNEGLPMLLYNQSPAFTFILSWVLKTVSLESEKFDEASQGYDRIFSNLDIEIERYKLMSHWLEEHIVEPWQEEDRDSCLFYSNYLLAYHQMLRESLEVDQQTYRGAVELFNETRKFVELRYSQLEDYVFKQGQADWFYILSNWNTYTDRMQKDLAHQYGLMSMQSTVNQEEGKQSRNDRWEHTVLLYGGILMAVKLLLLCGLGILLTWGFSRTLRSGKTLTSMQTVVSGLLLGCLVFLLLQLFKKPATNLFIDGMGSMFQRFVFLLVIILASLLVRVKAQSLKTTFKLYLPAILLALAIIVCRVSFLPDTALTLILAPILLVASILQLVACIRFRKKVARMDRILGEVSLGVLAASLILALLGFTFASMLVLTWWYIQLAAILAAQALYELLRLYKEKRMDPRTDKYLTRLAGITGLDQNSLRFRFTWFHELAKGVILPVFLLLSIPFCLQLTLDVFDFDEFFHSIYIDPFLHLTDNDGKDVLQLSLRIIIRLSCLFFVFRYANKVFRYLWMSCRYAAFCRKTGHTRLHSNELNLSLGNSIISVLVWMLYIAVAVILMKIPVGSLGLVAGGLSAGIGIAMKDTLNNFIYGIQLMSGRLRVGDYIECDGSRGQVTDMGYQYTEICTDEGNSIIFTNSALFDKNFLNLTRNNPYEYLKLSFTVKYDTDVERARALLKEACQALLTKDKDGRDIVEPGYGLHVVVDKFDEGGITFALKQDVLVSERYGYISRAKELIFKTLAANNIEIPFQQIAVHLVQDQG